MAKVRSPNYPLVDLGTALGMARKAYLKDNRNRMARMTLAKHLGHDSLSGPALGKIGALRAYGLIDGAGDEIRITDDAVTALMAPEASQERADAMRKLALRPGLFREISNDFEGVPSEDNLRFWLSKRGFTADAAAKAASTYLGTMKLVPESGEAYDSDSTELESEMETADTPAPETAKGGLKFVQALLRQPPQGMRQAVFPLSEGDVTIHFPIDLSAEGFEELGDYLEIFLRKAKRDAAKTEVTPAANVMD